MLIAQTSRGPARYSESKLELLELDRSVDELIRAGELSRASKAKVRETVSPEAVRLFPPVARPGKICIVGLNYLDHAKEIGAPLPDRLKFSWAAGSAVTGPNDDIVLPSLAATEVDYEAELAVIIGSLTKAVPIESAWDHVAGITAVNDVSARDVQLGRGANPTANVGVGKSFDTFKPTGPAVLTADAIKPGRHLNIQTRVDGEVRQRSTTANLIFGLAELISIISDFATLEPGDLILTGTPSGVGLTSGRYLMIGQVVEVELEGVGTLRNRVVASA